ncbi:MAG: thioredoxin domain-containing protein [Bacteroidales bacterium]
MTKIFAAAMMAVGMLAATTAVAAEQEKGRSTDLVEGRADAPITMIEYESYSCSHCAEFHRGTYPRLKKDWIATGKVRLVHRFAPGDIGDLAAARLTVCAARKNRSLRDAFYAKSEDLAKLAAKERAEEKQALVIDIAANAGMPIDDMQACIGERELSLDILHGMKEAKEKYALKGTPTFIIDGTPVPGNISYEKLVPLLKAIAK